MTSVQTESYVVSSLNGIPYDIQAEALSFAQRILYHSAYDYVYALDYDDTEDVYTYSLYYGYGLRTLSDGFSKCHLAQIVYDVDISSVSRFVSVSGSYNGQVVGETVAGSRGSFSGSFPSVSTEYTITQSVEFDDIEEVVFPDDSGFFCSSLESYPHIERGLNYADIGQGVFAPLLIGSVAVGLFIQIFRRFG